MLVYMPAHRALPPRFPLTGPVVTVSPPVRHPWVNEQVNLDLVKYLRCIDHHCVFMSLFSDDSRWQPFSKECKSEYRKAHIYIDVLFMYIQATLSLLAVQCPLKSWQIYSTG